MALTRLWRVALSGALVVGVCACTSTGGGLGGHTTTLGRIERMDPRLDALLAKDAKLEVLDFGFRWTEGPVWVKEGGYLLFSDIPPNQVWKWKEGEGCSLYLHPSGYTGSKPRGGEPGSNALILDPQGRLVLCQHGDRRVARMDAPLTDPQPKFITLADRYEGKRLSSPNDLVYHSSGALYFTDPPYGLEGNVNDPEKEIPFQGVYRLGTDGKLTLLVKDVTRPNGLAFSPDEKKLYVGSSDPDKAIWMVYDVKPDGTLDNGRVFFDSTRWVGKFDYKGLPDGMKVDEHGNLWTTGPGGVLIIAPDGTLLGLIRTYQATSNCAWGEDGRTFFITCDMYLLRLKTTTRGARF
jgi:gluconolactonase